MTTIAPLHIGPVRLATNLLLAPMAGYCDLAFRLVARRCGGVGLASTALLCPKGVLHETRKSLELAATTPADSPLAMQIYGGEADELCDAARWAKDRGADIIDFNMGCAVPKITSRNGGSRLLCDPHFALKLVERLVQAIRHTPLTVKLRLGWDDRDIVAPMLASRMEQLGVAAVTVHGRTAEMQFTGASRLDAIGQVVAAVKTMPIIGNGDVRSPADALRMIDQTGCAGVMIGRAALSRPWIFRDAWAFLTTGATPPPPTLAEKLALMREHFYGMVKFRRERVAVLEFRKWISWYAKELHPCRALREEMRVINSVADFENALARFLAWRAESPAAAETTVAPSE